MKVVIQRVVRASVDIDNVRFSEINAGLLILLGVELADNDEDIDWLCSKIAKLRLFDDQDGVMNLSVHEKNGEVLVVSQFTLHAKTKKGNRPSYIQAAPAEFASLMFEKFVNKMEMELAKKVSTGKFGAMMQVTLINDGPVTIIIDSKNRE